MTQPPQTPSVTELLHDARRGDDAAFDRLYSRVYDQLHALAHVVRQGRAGDTLNTTVLVHEAYLKLVPSKDLAWENRVHFFRVAARAMRQVLITAAERRMAQKRGAGRMLVTLNEELQGGQHGAEELLALDEALDHLADLSPRQAEVVECRYFAGLTVGETAHALGVSEPTVKRDWRTARAWLSHALAQ